MDGLWSKKLEVSEGWRNQDDEGKGNIYPGAKHRVSGSHIVT